MPSYSAPRWDRWMPDRRESVVRSVAALDTANRAVRWNYRFPGTDDRRRRRWEWSLDGWARRRTLRPWQEYQRRARSLQSKDGQ